MKASVILEHSWTEIFSDEKITLRCAIQGAEGTQWTYEWRRDELDLHSTHSKYRSTKVYGSDSGKYSCRGRSYKLTTEWSEALRLTVSDKPRASLRADKTVIPAGGSVTLTCSVDVSSGWKYYWYRHNSSEAQSINDQSDTVSVSEGGIYHCRGGRGDPEFMTAVSSEVTIKETVPNKASVILDHSWPQIFSGEMITLRCDIQGAEGTQWTYEWKPDKFNIYPTSNKIRTKVTESDSGEYRCLGRRDTFSSTEWSEALRLTVSDKPRASLRADKTVIPAGGSVTLTCSVDVSSGWKYYWYRRTSESSGAQPINDQSDTVSVSEGGIKACTA
ncbi:protein sax-3-like [Parambassis ranga]|uniref:Protein sax-3-like n=1 Tax=Parambassis ranga TaxID=210632 RepID=A0A6P7IQA1_9TELE|nr:protein sax-3-like [Parambassis ranga]XP_028262889.1 protein sax-3-like [Parambassis ranga]